MALFNCPNCGKEISDRGAICPYCKNWINTEAYRQMSSQKKISHMFGARKSERRSGSSNRPSWISTQAMVQSMA